MKYTISLQVRVDGSIPDNLLDKHVLLETEDVDERERFVARVLKHKRLGILDGPEEEEG